MTPRPRLVEVPPLLEKVKRLSPKVDLVCSGECLPELPIANLDREPTLHGLNHQAQVFSELNVLGHANLLVVGSTLIGANPPSTLLLSATIQPLMCL